jgi:hypothetical protein
MGIPERVHIAITRSWIVRLSLSIVIAGIIMFSLYQWDKPQVLDFQGPNFTVSPNITEFTRTITISSCYFRSRARLYVAMSSPFIDSFERFSLNMSLKGGDWSEVHPYTELPSLGDTTKYTLLGYVDLNQLDIVIQGRYLIPPQTLRLPANSSKEVALSSFKANIWVVTVLVPRDYLALLFSFMALLGACLGILSIVFPLAAGARERTRPEGELGEPTERARQVENPLTAAQQLEALLVQQRECWADIRQYDVLVWQTLSVNTIINGALLLLSTSATYVIRVTTVFFALALTVVLTIELMKHQFFRKARFQEMKHLQQELRQLGLGIVVDGARSTRSVMEAVEEGRFENISTGWFERRTAYEWIRCYMYAMLVMMSLLLVQVIITG